MSAAIDRITVVTPDMSCGHCVAAIEGDLGALAGVQSVKADLPTKQVTVAFDPAVVTVPAIEAALDDAGYPVAK
jgi:copper chaperone